MTKLRAPLTIEDAANRVIGIITMKVAMEATGRSADYLRALTDSDKRYKLTIEDGIKLDIAHMAAGYEGAPIHETAGLLLDVASAERFSDRHKFAHLVASFVKEVGEAGGALVHAQLPGAGPEQDREATRQVQDVIEAGKVMLAFLARTADAQAPP